MTMSPLDRSIVNEYRTTLKAMSDSVARHAEQTTATDPRHTVWTGRLEAIEYVLCGCERRLMADHHRRTLRYWLANFSDERIARHRSAAIKWAISQIDKETTS